MEGTRLKYKEKLKKLKVIYSFFITQMKLSLIEKDLTKGKEENKKISKENQSLIEKNKQTEESAKNLIQTIVQDHKRQMDDFFKIAQEFAQMAIDAKKGRKSKKDSNFKEENMLMQFMENVKKGSKSVAFPT